MRATTCPSSPELHQYAVGQLAEDDAQRIEDHLRGCPPCVEALQAQAGNDTLLQALAARSTDGSPENDVVNDLIHKLRALRGSATGSGLVSTGSGPTEPDDVRTLLAPPQAPDEMGRLGGYRVLQVLGKGGMGAVFLAEDTTLKRRVALKVMRPSLAANAAARQRFLREAQAQAAIEHDHIIAIHQVGADRGTVFLAMPLLKGKSLEEWLKVKKTIPPAQVVHIGKQIARGLEAAHQRGLVHRDIKPSNLWLEEKDEGGRMKDENSASSFRLHPSSSQRVKILDFGLARAAEGQEQITQSGAIVGTPAYMAPEQARAETVDGRADLFSLGCVLYRMCTGHQPFEGKTPLAVLANVTLTEPKPVAEASSEVPAALADLIMRLLAKDRQQRPESAEAVVAALDEIERSQASGGVHPRRVDATTAGHGGDKPRRSLWWAVAVLLLAGGAVLAAQIIIRIKNKDGQVTEIRTDAANEVEVIRPAPPRLPAGAALSSQALVSQPARLQGVDSWTIESVGHRHFINNLAFSPDGGQVVAASEDGALRILDPASGRLLRILVGHEHAARWVAWSPDGKWLASSGQDNAVRVWEAGSGRLVHSATQDNSISALAWAPDSQHLAFHVSVGKVRLWEVRSGAFHNAFLSASSTRGLAWLRDGRRLACGLENGQIEIWDVHKGQRLQVLEGHTDGLVALAMSPDGKTLASGSRDKTVRLWEAESGKHLATFAGPTTVVLSMTWSPDSKTVAAAYSSPDPAVRLWQAGSNKSVREISRPQSIRGLAWSPDGQSLVGGDRDGHLVFLDCDSGKPRQVLRNQFAAVRSVTWSHDGNMLICGQADGNWSGRNVITLRNAATGEMVRSLPMAAGPIAILALSPNGKTLAAGDSQTVQIWNLADGTRLHNLPLGVNALAWSPDGRILIGGSATDSSIQLWDPVTGKPLRRLDEGKGRVRFVACSPDSKTLASATADENAVRFHDMASGQLLQSWESKGEVHSATWSPDGKALAYTSLSNEPACLREVATGRVLHTFGTGPYSTFLQLAPDGQTLALKRTPITGLEFWDLASGKELPKLEDCKLIHLLSVAWSPDSRTVAMAEQTHVTRFWDMAHNRQQGVLVTLAGGQYLAIDPTGHYRGTPGVEEHIVYVAQKDDGTQETLTPAEFARKYNWKNDPERVRLTAK